MTTANEMTFAGIDLAWGENAWTGLALVDAAGRLVAMTRVRTDAEIAERLAAFPGGLIVAVDAPLIVRNATGRRPCEQLVSTLFGRFHAGAHSSNLSIPSFKDGPRGGRLASVLGLDVDPYFAPRAPVRRAIEVYPHPATVTLFGLDRVVPYKQKPGRDPESRRAAFLELMTLVDRLSTADPPFDTGDCAEWQEARRAVARASSHAEINPWEDAVDAVICAYIGLHRWWHGEAESAVLGDVESGYIVVPLDDRMRSGATSPPRRLSNAEVEQIALDVVRRLAEAEGASVSDTRYIASAVGDLVIDGRPVEIKASSRSVRGEDLWLEPAQAQALLDGALDLLLVEHVQPDGSGVVRRFDAATLERLLPRLREHRYFTLPVPVAVYDATDEQVVGPAD
ncbi:MAG TPA: DUF429 domain-containing protein [Mycobacteriales bacterium]|nr:DUF429 domain-containing protein [Mycobacteriales bacterium]